MTDRATSSPGSVGEPARGSAATLVAHAALTLVREELAHALAAPTRYFELVFGLLEKGKPLTDEQLEIAREEVTRLRQLIASLRHTPGIPIAPRVVHLSSVVQDAVRDVHDSVPGPRGQVLLNVAESIVVSVDATAIGFVIYVVVSTLGANGRHAVRIDAPLPPVGAVTATLSFASQSGSAVESGFTTQSWVSADSEAISLAVARRVARASNMVLRPASEGAGVLSLEVPLAIAGA